MPLIALGWRRYGSCAGSLTSPATPRYSSTAFKASALDSGTVSPLACGAPIHCLGVIGCMRSTLGDER
ncbi:hypothetical protein NO561_01590 [Xanthomonas oryzae pv. oryzae]|nr:hypothetical protein [Xanthomonas oryzae]UUC38416.1 hypothetical protein NO561_01590 [Xanthomonas oryzae pv. oryzae]WAY25775.1 hypothetical protein O5966_09170 [Xanthomonas oryzae pv. oryzae]